MHLWYFLVILTLVLFLVPYVIFLDTDHSKKDDKIRKRYNQVLHLTQDTTWESNKKSINITNKSQEVSPFRAGDHKAAMNRRESIRNKRHKNTNDPQKKYCLGTVGANLSLSCNVLCLHNAFIFITAQYCPNVHRQVSKKRPELYR